MAGASHAPPPHILGVDFSGARDAARRIWVCEALADGDALSVAACYPLDDVVPAARGPGPACVALVQRIAAAPAPLAVGFDFPFGLERTLLPPHVRDWGRFLRWFADAFGSPADFRHWCRERAASRGLTEGDLRRATDKAAGTPWVPHNLRLHKQTFFGIRHVLAPLVAEHGCAGVPNQWPPGSDRWLLETCPASTLKNWQAVAPYKGRRLHHRRAREGLLRKLGERGVRIGPGALRERLLANAGGDALDSVLCAWAAWRAVRTPQALLAGVTAEHRLEGWVYA